MGDTYTRAMLDAGGGRVLEAIGSLSSDVLLLGGALTLCVALGLTKGKDTLLALLLALYPAVVVTGECPFYGRLGGSMGGVLEPMVVFLVTWVAVFFIIQNYIHSMYPASGFWRLVEIVVLSLGAVGLCVAALYHVVGIERIHDFSSLIDTLVAAPAAWAAWIVAPLMSIPLFVRS